MPAKKEKITKPCHVCGKLITRMPSWMKGKVCCNLECSRKHLSKKMTNLNEEMNPDRMTLEVRTKLREIRLNTGEGKTYTKTFGRHTHKIVAEQKIGRPLILGDIVHHIDFNRRNNDPDNLHVFASQSQHTKFHQEVKYGYRRKYDLYGPPIPKELR